MTRPSAPSDRTRVRRVPKRGLYDRPTIDAILDEAFVCHVGFTQLEQPFVIPTVHWRMADQLYLHGSAASRLIEHGATDVSLCVTVTLIDGVVFARSAFHHSLNYRSVVLLGRARLVNDLAEKRSALNALVNRFAAERSRQVREANDRELKATAILALPIVEASAKVRTGGPIDDEDDLDLPVWAGVIPLRLVPGAAEVSEPSVSGLSAPKLLSSAR